MLTSDEQNIEIRNFHISNDELLSKINRIKKKISMVELEEENNQNLD